MPTINVSQDIVPVGEFKTGISKWLKSIREKKHPIIITQNGRPAGVLIAPEEYDQLVYTKAFLDSINRGIQDINNADIFTTDELIEEIQEARKNRV
ncbi:MAG TPA: type II toxin-antitoxin system Phd/YefM family antitoxin [Candidatus Marinimicrobia bacterium]|nr:type II toxin-antitoxin system Phd/YefM family antitoxin [Candidatus Neomarinimicrobiota bacterium]HRS51765.1 type II toxin-antitoxin system Phd/YefM family antitoxin [Candidatus Neomarinimicrobiota bacterium]